MLIDKCCNIKQNQKIDISGYVLRPHIESMDQTSSGNVSGASNGNC